MWLRKNGLEEELPKDNKNLVVLTGVVIEVDVEDGRYEAMYVLHNDSLHMQIDNGSGLMRQKQWRSMTK